MRSGGRGAGVRKGLAPAAGEGVGRTVGIVGRATIPAEGGGAAGGRHQRLEQCGQPFEAWKLQLVTGASRARARERDALAE